MAVSSSMETSTSQDEHLHRQTLPSQDLPLTSNHQQMKGPDTLVEGQAVKGFCVAKDVYRRGKQLIALVPVILDSRPAVPFTVSVCYSAPLSMHVIAVCTVRMYHTYGCMHMHTVCMCMQPYTVLAYTVQYYICTYLCHGEQVDQRKEVVYKSLLIYYPAHL